jgi:hypothetical protein
MTVLAIQHADDKTDQPSPHWPSFLIPRWPRGRQQGQQCCSRGAAWCSPYGFHREPGQGFDFAGRFWVKTCQLQTSPGALTNGLPRHKAGRRRRRGGIWRRSTSQRPGGLWRQKRRSFRSTAASTLHLCDAMRFELPGAKQFGEIRTNFWPSDLASTSASGPIPQSPIIHP